MQESKTVFQPLQVQHEGKNYQLIIPMWERNGVLETAEEMLTNREALAELIESGFGGLREIV